MLQSYSSNSAQSEFTEEHRTDSGLAHYFAIVRRRKFYLLIPFLFILLLGSAIVTIQRPIFRAEGKILVETPDIPIDLVKPTVTDTANQRIQIIQQRITTRDNLLEIVKKYGLFAEQQRWMSSSQILDLMRERTKLQLVDLTLPTAQNNLTIAFTLTFDYEDPQIASKVANEFLTLILNEDARNRTNRAAETTKFLEKESQRLQASLSAIQAKITAIALAPPDPIKDIPDQLKEQREQLTRLRLELVQKTAVYSRAHPQVVALTKKIAALEKIVASAPAATAQFPTPAADNGLDLLKQQLAGTEKALDEANAKLSAARLGENLERNQQSERLQVIEQPVPPQRPVKPNRPKLFALALALSVMASFGATVAAESLDRSIHRSEDLAGTVDSRLIVAIPSITTEADTRRKRRKLWLLLGGLFTLLLAAVAAILYVGASIDLASLLDRSWIDQLRHLSK